MSPGFSQVLATLGRGVRQAATERLPLKAAAVLFALVLWLVVRVQEPTEELVPVRFQPALDTSLVLESPPPTVRALVSGPAQELLKLYSIPPVVRERIGAEVTDEYTILLRPSDVELPSGVNAVVRDVQPRRITLQFASTLQRRVPVRSELRFSPDTGLVITGAPVLDPDSVTLVGDRRVVYRLDEVRTAPMELVVSSEREYDVPLDTAALLGARARPSRVRVRVPIRRQLPVPEAPDDTVPGDSM